MIFKSKMHNENYKLLFHRSSFKGIAFRLVAYNDKTTCNFRNHKLKTTPKKKKKKQR